MGKSAGMKKLLCIFLLLTGWAQAGPIFTDDRQLPRDYTVSEPIKPVAGGIFEQIEWQVISPGLRRKVLYNDRLTLVLMEIEQPLDDKPVSTHYHAHDQITYVLEGRGRVRVGDAEKEVSAGGAYVAPSNVHHGLKPLTTRLVIMEVFTPIREDFRGKP